MAMTFFNQPRLFETRTHHVFAGWLVTLNGAANEPQFYSAPGGMAISASELRYRTGASSRSGTEDVFSWLR